MTQWKDATIYSQSEPMWVKPIDAWCVYSGGISIFIRSRARNYPGEWVCTCSRAGMENFRLKLASSEPHELAKEYAICAVGDELTGLRNDFQKLLED